MSNSVPPSVASKGRITTDLVETDAHEIHILTSWAILTSSAPVWHGSTTGTLHVQYPYGHRWQQRCEPIATTYQLSCFGDKMTFTYLVSEESDNSFAICALGYEMGSLQVDAHTIVPRRVRIIEELCGCGCEIQHINGANPWSVVHLAVVSPSNVTIHQPGCLWVCWIVMKVH